jgi:hypothetical protein
MVRGYWVLCWETVYYIGIYFIEVEKIFKKKRFKIYEFSTEMTFWGFLFGLWGDLSYI